MDHREQGLNYNLAGEASKNASVTDDTQVNINI